MKDPSRILEGALPGSLERALLDSAGVAGPTDAQCEETWVALSAHLAAAAALSVSSLSCTTGLIPGAAEAPGLGGAAPLSTTTAGAAGVTMAAKVAAMLGLTVLGAAVVMAGAAPRWAHRVERAVEVPATVSRAPATSTLQSPFGAETTVSGVRAPALPSVPSSGTIAAPLSHPSAPPTSARRPPRDPGAPPLLPAESSLVVAARAEVRAGRCVDALERLREGSNRFRGGALEQERQALRVSALGCAGRTDEAAAAAAAFVQSYPESPYAATVQPYLGGP